MDPNHANQHNVSPQKDIDSTRVFNAAFPKGSYVGPYQITEQVGQGGMAKVYKAYYQKLERFVAIKVMDKQIISKEEHKRFIAEAKLTAKLQHPNIVTIYDAGIHQGLNYIVMDYIEGTSLQEWIEKSKFSMEQSCNIVKEIAKALHYAHNEGIIHRDIKPSNIIITKDGRPVIMDFGLAKNTKMTQEITKSGIIIGTPKYMAPEQIKGENKSISRSTDVYGLGAVFYEMLTGKSVIMGETPLSISYNILNKEVTPPRTYRPEIPHDIQSICLKALEKTKQKRYRSTNAMAEDIDRYLSGEAVFAKQESKLYLIKKRALRYRIWLLLIFSLILLIGNVVQFTFFYQKNKDIANQLTSQQEQYQKLLIEVSDNPNQKILKAIDYFTINDLNNALETITEVITDDSNHAQAYYYRAYFLTQLQNYNEAVQNVNRAIDLSPDLSIAYSLRGKILIYLNSYEQGIDDLKKFLEKSPEKETFLLLCKAYLQTEQYQKAQDGYQRVINNDRKNLEAYNGMAKCLFKQKQYSQAINYARQAVRIKQNDAQAFYILGYSYYFLSDWEKSIWAFSTAQVLDRDLKLNDILFPFYYFRGNAYNKMGNTQKALEDLNVSLQILNSLSRQDDIYIYSLLERAQIYRDQNQHQKAIKDYQIIQNIAPQKLTREQVDYINKYE